MGRVNRGNRGAESRAERVTTASSSGNSEAFRAKSVPADWRRCFFSVHDVTNTVRVNFSLARNWVSLSIRSPTWTETHQDCNSASYVRQWCYNVGIVTVILPTEVEPLCQGCPTPAMFCFQLRVAPKSQLPFEAGHPLSFATPGNQQEGITLLVCDHLGHSFTFPNC